MISQSAKDTCISKKMGQSLTFALINVELLCWFRKETPVKYAGLHSMGKNNINIIKYVL
ncbi:MAG TPA: hypothetical protein VMV43_06730 [Candidatus Nanopelagicaceae bacterium]|nr:hypothetical protein [Candidatus Nanopelagicaceae bacterium]